MSGIATAAASVREVAPRAPIDLELADLLDRIGALEVTFSALNERLAPVMRDDSHDPTPADGMVDKSDPDRDTRSELRRRVDVASRGIAAVTRDLERAIARLEV